LAILAETGQMNPLVDAQWLARGITESIFIAGLADRFEVAVDRAVQ
jgi:hypothetical protein